MEFVELSRVVMEKLNLIATNTSTYKFKKITQVAGTVARRVH